jgi:glucose/arabinose dehydrogenase/PKD repeat protein
MSSTAAATVPPNFEDRLLAQARFPTGLAFTPDGRLLITIKTGAVLVYADGALRSSPALDLASQLCADLERGLAGVAVDPSFPDSHHVYLYYTYDKGTDSCGTNRNDPASTPVNRISRFVLGNDDTIDPASETVLIDNIPSPVGYHNGGDLHFGKDGYLYATVGDGGCDYSLATGCASFNGAARYRHALLGKILRITSDGDVPPDNPYTGPGTTRCNRTGHVAPGLFCQEIYASGLRNPFRFAFDDGAPATRFFINDVGQTSWEEIDEGVRGADYGWNLREGHCVTDSTTDCGPPPAGLTNPIFDYGRSAGCTAVTAGAFVPRGVWPAQYERSYLFADFVCNKIFQLARDGSGAYSATEFASDTAVAVTAMTFGPAASPGDLYYVTWGPVSGLRRLSFTGGANRVPTAVAQAAPTNGALPLDVRFDASSSSDPDDDALTYRWDFGDGSAVATQPVVIHRYATAGTYTATLRVRDPSGAEDSQTVRIDAGNLPPAPRISSPSSGTLFSVRQAITLTGSATDPENGTLPNSALTWEVVKHHATHTHPYLPPTTGNGLSIVAPEPEDFASTTNSYLEVRLTATDSRGLTSTVGRAVRPALVNLAFATNPAGLRLELNGAAAPPSLTSWKGWQLALGVPEPQFDGQGRGQTFVSWSDGGARVHPITTPASSQTYTATFTPRYVRPKAAHRIDVPLVPAYGQCTSANRIHGPPLAQPSCHPPVPASPNTTVGTPDANGFLANSTGSARFVVVRGNPSTAANEADMRIEVSITDVIDLLRGADYYVGDLRTVIDARITDRNNGPASDSATTTGFPWSVDMPCRPDIGTGASTCSVVTTANTLIPGAVIESKRAIWGLGSVKVLDGGPDGDVSTDDNGLLATQGIFLP